MLILKVVTSVIIGRSAQVLILNGWELGPELVAVVIEGWDLMQRSAPVGALVLAQLGKVAAREGQEA